MASKKSPRLCMIVCIFLLGIAYLNAKEPLDALAEVMLAKAGIKVTLCVTPRVGDGVLVAALAQAGVSQIYALAQNDKIADVARKPSAVSGVLGSQVIIEVGSPHALPLGDWVSDLYIVTDATDSNLKQLSPAEAGRVLAPYRGVALVGNPAGTEGGLSKTILAEWAEKIGGEVSIQDDASGLWVIVKSLPLKGGDDWSHYYHGADGNPVSEDTALTAGRLGLQWFGKPLWGGKHSTLVASAGRVFTADATWYFKHHNAMHLPNELIARNLYNGEVLWRRALAKDFGDNSSLIVATPEHVFIKDANGILDLDAETGTILRRLVLADEDHHCRWLLLSDGVLLGVAGPKYVMMDDIRGLTVADRQNAQQDNLFCEEIVAWDADTGKELWRFREKRIDPNKMVARDGRLFLYANLAYAACLDLRSGQQIWKTDSPIPDPKNPGMALWFHLNDMLQLSQGAIATKDVYLINRAAHLQCQAFSATDGHLLWERIRGKQGDDEEQAKKLKWTLQKVLTYPLVLGNTILSRGDPLEVLTGKPVAMDFPGFDIGGCGRFTATTSGLLFGQDGQVYDSQSQQAYQESYGMKSPCPTSKFVAGGVQIGAPGDCGCVDWHGFMVSRAISDQKGSRTGPPLEIGAKLDVPAESVKADSSDWPTYRANNTRSASSAVVVPTKAVVRWISRPNDHGGHDYDEGRISFLASDVDAAPPIAVGERIWLGTAEGSIVCLDRKSGTELWKYWTGGSIMGSPTWWEGRIYIGSCDGWLYCLDAASGQLAWRYRLAPEERRIMLMGRLSSAWPVLTNVLVHEGVAYASAGLVGQLDGAVLCALDARSGAKRWNKRFGGASQGETVSPSPGQLAWYQDRLWWHAGFSGVFVVDPATGNYTSAIDFASMDFGTYSTRGKPKAESMTWRSSHGQDIGILPGGWIAIGGMGIFNSGFDCNFLLAEPAGALRDEHGYIDLLNLPTLHATSFIPAWDDKSTLLSGIQGSPNKSAPLLCQELATILTTEAKAHPFNLNIFAKQFWSGGLVRKIKPELVSGQRKTVLPKELDVEMRSAILASNAVVFVGGKGRQWNGHLYAVDRADSSVLWDVTLPTAPVLGGLLLNRAGDVLVPLKDGRVACIGDEREAVPQSMQAVNGTKAGLSVEWFQSDTQCLVGKPPLKTSGWRDEMVVNLPTNFEFNHMQPVRKVVAETIPSPTGTMEYPCLQRVTGFIDVPKTGKYSFFLNGDRQVSVKRETYGRHYKNAGPFTQNVFRFLLDGEAIYEDMLLAQGRHHIELHCYYAATGNDLQMEWAGPALKRSIVPAQALSHLPE